MYRRVIVFVLFVVLFCNYSSQGYSLPSNFDRWGRQSLHRVDPAHHDSWLQLQENILRAIQVDTGIRVGLFIKNLTTGDVFSVNANDTFPSASLIKIGVMLAAFQAEKEGLFSWGDSVILRRRDRVGGSGSLKYQRTGTRKTMNELVNLMITISDNIATNMLARKLSAKYINRVLSDNGFKVMAYRRPIMDLKKKAAGLINPISPREVGTFMEKLWRGRLVSPSASKKMLAVMLAQKQKSRLPRYFSANVPIAHKTGTMRDVAHDAGVLFLPGGPYIVSVNTFFDDPGKLREASSLIADMGWVLAAYTESPMALR